MRTIITLLGLTLGQLHAGTGTAWRTVLPSPTAYDLHDLTVTSGELVAVGVGGTVLATTDGETWTRRETGTRETFARVAHLNNRWFAYGYNGSIFNSDDLVGWGQRTNLYGAGDMAYGNGRYVALTTDTTNSIRVSSDGDTWHPRSFAPGRNVSASALTFAYNRFWLAAANFELFTSTDGETWTPSPGVGSGWRYERFVNADGRLFLLTRESYYGNYTLYELVDGVSWVSRSGIGAIADFGYDGAQFYKREGTLHAISADALTWTAVETEFYGVDLRTVCRFQDRWFGLNRVYGLMTSSDGVHWNSATTFAPWQFSNLVSVDHHLLVGNGQMSSDGETWTDGGFVVPLAPDDTRSFWYRLYQANDRAFAVAAYSQVSNREIEIWSIDDIERGHRVASFEGSVDMQDRILHANGSYYLALRRSGVMSLVTSPDGESWTELAWPENGPPIGRLVGADGARIYGAVYGANSSELWSSADGTVWTRELVAPASAFVVGLAAGPEGIMAVSQTGYFFKPSSGSWSYTPSSPLKYVGHDGRGFVAVGQTADYRSSYIHFRNGDGSWTTDLIPEYGSEVSLATVPGRTVVMIDGTINVSDHDSSLQLSQGLPLQRDGVVGEPFQLSVTASSDSGAPLRYQWYASGVDIAGATSPSLTVALPSSALAQSSYGVRVTDGTSTVRAETAFRLFDSAKPTFYGNASNPMVVRYDNINVTPVTGQFSVSAQGPGTLQYTWFRNGVEIPGATTPQLTLSLRAEDLGTIISVNVSNAFGRISANHTIVGPQPAFVADIYVGRTPYGDLGKQSLTLSASPTNATAYQWRRNGAAIPGANERYYSDPDLTLDEGGWYDVVISNGWGSATSEGRFIAGTTGRLTNLSVRALAGSGEATLTPGVVIARLDGNGAPLIRAIGPGLGAYDVETPLRDPALRLVTPDQQVLAANDQWWTVPGLEARFNELGAFALGFDSLDAALIATDLPEESSTSRFTAPVTSISGEDGDALVEVYEHFLGGYFGLDRLINLSCRAEVSDDHPLIAGLVVDGDGPVKLLIRAAGPALVPLGVTGAIQNPRLVLYNRSQTEIGNNDTWHLADNLAEAEAARNLVGAFPFAADSNDAALYVTLDPGVYTVIVEGVDAGSGIALVEVFEVP